MGRSPLGMTVFKTAGSSPLLLETCAVSDGDGSVINGQKWFTSAANGPRTGSAPAASITACAGLASPAA